MTFWQDKDLVVLASFEWNFLWQRHQILATAFCKVCHKVVFIESLANRNPGIKDIPRIIERLIRFAVKKSQRKTAKTESRVPENLIIVSPLVLPATLKIYRKINKRLFIPFLARLVSSRGLRNPIVLNYLPNQTSLDLIGKLRPSLSIYDCVQNWPQYPRVSKDTEVIEKEIIRAADVVFTDSLFLENKIKPIRSDVQRILPGVDFDHFQVADTGRWPKKIRTLCYFGGINEIRIDFGLLKEIASGNTLEIHMIGPVKSRIPRLPGNIIFSGELSYQELPKYLRAFDCLILPYKVTEFTKGIIPAKLFECFATGKPILASPLPSFYEFSDFIYIAENAREFLKIIENIRVLETEEKYEQRKELARHNSWESRFQEMATAIHNKMADCIKPT
jgi:glycosyltransferase involved in cell wall biosynthesis